MAQPLPRRLLLCDATTLRPLRACGLEAAGATALLTCRLPDGLTADWPQPVRLVELRLDDDGTSAMALVAGPEGLGPLPSDFRRRVDPDGGRAAEAGDPWSPTDMLEQVMQVIRDRKAGRGMTNREGKSYVQRLLEKGPPKLREKITEEADELATAIEAEPATRVASEAADLIFHALVGLAFRDLGLLEVAQIFRERFGVSGIDEKAARPPPTSE